MRPARRFFPALALLAAVACAEPQWHKPGASQAVLALDRADCAASAEAQGRAASFSGRDVIPKVRDQALAQCLRRKGWRPAAEVDVDTGRETSAPPVTPPPGFSAVAADPGFWTYEAQDGSRLEVTLQRTATGFVDVPFPVPPGLSLYDRGRLDAPGGPVDWALFFGAPGRERDAWQAAFGAWVQLAKGERLVVSAALPLPEPSREPPPGLRIGAVQRRHLERLREYFLAWLAQPAAAPVGQKP